MWGARPALVGQDLVGKAFGEKATQCGTARPSAVPAVAIAHAPRRSKSEVLKTYCTYEQSMSDPTIYVSNSCYGMLLTNTDELSYGFQNADVSSVL